jgi:hypothetical protein
MNTNENIPRLGAGTVGGRLGLKNNQKISRALPVARKCQVSALPIAASNAG